MARPRKASSSSPGRRRRGAAPAGDRLEHEGRHAEHIDRHFGRIVDLLGPAPSSAGAAAPAGAAGSGSDDDDEESEEA